MSPPPPNKPVLATFMPKAHRLCLEPKVFRVLLKLPPLESRARDVWDNNVEAAAEIIEAEMVAVVVAAATAVPPATADPAVAAVTAPTTADPTPAVTILEARVTKTARAAVGP